MTKELEVPRAYESREHGDLASVLKRIRALEGNVDAHRVLLKRIVKALLKED